MCRHEIMKGIDWSNVPSTDVDPAPFSTTEGFTLPTSQEASSASRHILEQPPTITNDVFNREKVSKA